MKKFGLIGYPLTHSFSKKYFTEKFQQLGLFENYQYELFEIERISSLPEIIKNNPELAGLNVTIPHKLNVIPYLHKMDAAAEKIGAVNVIKITENKKLYGYNSDYYGFKRSLEEFLEGPKQLKALILGNGGATRAVSVALNDMNIQHLIVSRSPKGDIISYAKANKLLKEFKLIINCTPLGTFPNIDTAPDIDYNLLDAGHYLYDLVYNPETTRFMKYGQKSGAKTINGYNMLVYQAEKSWEIWNS